MKVIFWKLHVDDYLLYIIWAEAYLTTHYLFLTVVVQHWKGIFEKYDADGDGKISYHELKTMVQESSYSNDIPARVVRLIMEKADLDASGYLEFHEFIAMVCIFMNLS